VGPLDALDYSTEICQAFPDAVQAVDTTHQERSMSIDLRSTIRQALGRLESERIRIERQIAGLKQALNAGIGSADGETANHGAPQRRARRMSAAARRAVSAGMRAYWAKRKAARGKTRKTAA
jgi:hypothetical protein